VVARIVEEIIDKGNITESNDGVTEEIK